MVHSIGVTPPGPASDSIPLTRQVEEAVPGDETRRPERGVLRITWVGHSTVLIELDGLGDDGQLGYGNTDFPR